MTNYLQVTFLTIELVIHPVRSGISKYCVSTFGGLGNYRPISGAGSCYHCFLPDKLEGCSQHVLLTGFTSVMTKLYLPNFDLLPVIPLS